MKQAFKFSHVIKRNGEIVAFDKEKITNAIFKSAVSVGGTERNTALLLTEQVLQMLENTYPSKTIPSVEEVQDLIEKVLIENGHARTAKAFILYRAERTRIREKKNTMVQVEDSIPYKLLWKVYTWNVDHSCDTVEKLNRQMVDGRWKKILEESEKNYHAEIKKAADALLKRKGEMRVLLVAGPSSSGKTTTTLKIGEHLRAKGIHFAALNLDNYFKNLDRHPKDEYGDYDFEAPDALDLDLINEHLHALLKGKKIKVPHYDFKTGNRMEPRTELSLKKNEFLLIDSLHGLHSETTSSVPKEQKFKFYIEAICQIKDSNGNFVRWADLRMLRRMIRDNLHRNCRPERTVGHWHYVRKSEKKYIVPFIFSADYLFNGSLGYELPVYKTLISKQLDAIAEQYKNDPRKLDAFIRAERVKKLLDSLHSFPDVSAIPPNSVLREFIGSSSYKY